MNGYEIVKTKKKIPKDELMSNEVVLKTLRGDGMLFLVLIYKALATLH